MTLDEARTGKRYIPYINRDGTESDLLSNIINKFLKMLFFNGQVLNVLIGTQKMLTLL